MSMWIPKRCHALEALLLVAALVPAAAQMQMGPAASQDEMEGMDGTSAQPMPAKKAAPASTGGMKGMTAKTQKAAPVSPSQEMTTMPAPATPQPTPMGGMSTKPANQGMEMAPEPAHEAGDMEEAAHGSTANGGRILWIFLVVNAGIIATAAFLKSKRTFVKSSIEVKP
jgi:hypothetical protein